MTVVADDNGVFEARPIGNPPFTLQASGGVPYATGRVQADGNQEIVITVKPVAQPDSPPLPISHE